MPNSYKETNDAVQIIIPTWNALEFTKMTLKTLFQYTDHSYHLTIVDNGSEDGTGDYLKELEMELAVQFPEHMIGFNVIYNGENKGYAEANIIAWNSIPREDTRYACLCNNDLAFSPNWLSRMMGDMKRDPEIGVLGSMRPAPFVKHPHTGSATGEKQMQEMLSSFNLTEDRDPEAELKAYTNDQDWPSFVDEIEAYNYGEIMYLESPPAFVQTCCALVDRKIVETAGGVYRENWGKYGADDIDLSWRVAEIGKKTAMSSVYVHHHVHASISVSELDVETKLKEGDLHLYELWKDKIKGILRKELEQNPNFKEEVMYKEMEWFIFRILEHVIGEEEFWKDVELKNSGIEFSSSRSKETF
ncbi:MAG: glycosyltransferase [Candidatus Pacebacteria bacterium]|jgi:GT2 family glycosyltransferase|nr:glycosyltransferase [Candidatus Paceibacterota bacterium]MBT4652349.1 glycosyltransferase [Candidatus Paceibacterota bacterium]MBT6756176.1 glycosyltransferase [Candidatus Paceibacterota bacterium]MBT6921719.1 glycosyltransferase [Candidatus Paceibacterota bacterium]